MENKKILLINNTSDSVINFRQDLINFLKAKNNDIYIIAGDNKREKEIEKLGVNFATVKYSNRSKNPFQCLKILKMFGQKIKAIDPDIVLTFQLKPNTFGVLAAGKKGKGDIFSFVEGLGDPFQPHNFYEKIIEIIVICFYKYSMRYSKAVFFLNDFDKNEFLKRKIINKEKAETIPGIGINTLNFCPSENKADYNNVLMIARLIKNKGIFEFCEIANRVRRKRKDIHFYLYGPEAQIKKSNLEEYINNGDIFYGGESKNVIPIYNNCKIYVSTSYREGFPRTILEAMSLGKTVIASNVIGNNSAVINGETGLLIENKDIEGFAKAIIETIDNDNLLKKYGEKAREVCVKNYDSQIINNKLLEKIDSYIK